MSIEESRNGIFVYRDAFFAEVAGDKRNLRARVSELKELLLTKKNKQAPKEQVAHWTKDKNTAKVRLTAAQTSGALAVPASVQQIEADLKKEYAKTQRMAKSASTQEGPNASNTVSSGKKRKLDDESSTKGASTTSVRATIGDFMFDIDYQTTSSPQAKKQKLIPPKRPRVSSTKKPATSKSITATPKTKSQNPPASSIPDVARTKKTSKKPTTKAKQTARRSKPFNSSTPAAGLQPRARDFIVDEDEEPPPPYSIHAGHTPGAVQISGIYPIDTSATDGEDTLCIRLFNPRDQLWAGFNVGDKSGVIRTDRMDDIERSERKFFGWRSEDSEASELRFGEGCEGWIEFDGHGSVRGIFIG